MAYEILYGVSGKARYVSKHKKILQYSGYALLMAAMIGSLFWSAGGDWAATVSAFEQMANAFSRGDSVTDAFSAFCLEILQGA